MISRERLLRDAVADAERRLKVGEAGEHADRLARIQRMVRGEPAGVREPASPSAPGAYTSTPDRRDP